jgi:hypothetical protein
LWLLWVTHSTQDETVWKPLADFNQKAACTLLAAKLNALAAEGRTTLGISPLGPGKGFILKTRKEDGQAIVRSVYQCWPDFADPRGPSLK